MELCCAIGVSPAEMWRHAPPTSVTCRCSGADVCSGAQDACLWCGKRVMLGDDYGGVLRTSASGPNERVALADEPPPCLQLRFCGPRKPIDAPDVCVAPRARADDARARPPPSWRDRDDDLANKNAPPSLNSPSRARRHARAAGSSSRRPAARASSAASRARSCGSSTTTRRRRRPIPTPPPPSSRPPDATMAATARDGRRRAWLPSKRR